VPLVGLIALCLCGSLLAERYGEKKECNRQPYKRQSQRDKPPSEANKPPCGKFRELHLPSHQLGADRRNRGVIPLLQLQLSHSVFFFQELGVKSLNFGLKPLGLFTAH
jgi:hypothetical protein